VSFGCLWVGRNVSGCDAVLLGGLAVELVLGVLRPYKWPLARSIGSAFAQLFRRSKKRLISSSTAGEYEVWLWLVA